MYWSYTRGETLLRSVNMLLYLLELTFCMLYILIMYTVGTGTVYVPVEVVWPRRWKPSEMPTWP